MRSRRRVLGDFEQETLRGSRKCTVACILGRGGLGPSSGLGGARKSAEGRGRGNSVGGHIPKCFATKWAQGRDREVDRASGCRAQG